MATIIRHLSLALIISSALSVPIELQCMSKSANKENSENGPARVTSAQKFYNNGTTLSNNNGKNNGKTGVKWSPHQYKHFPPKNMNWKDIVSSTKSRAAKYHPKIRIETLERYVWKQGTPCTNKPAEKIMEFDDVIGASNGEETSCVKVEYGLDNTVHGHPITATEYKKLLKACKQ